MYKISISEMLMSSSLKWQGHVFKTISQIGNGKKKVLWMDRPPSRVEGRLRLLFVLVTKMTLKYKNLENNEKKMSMLW